MTSLSINLNTPAREQVRIGDGPLGSLAGGELYSETDVRERAFVVGIDVGGTFTDAVCSDGENVWRAKSPTNPAKFSDGVLGSCRLLAGQLEMPFEAFLAKIARFGLGTTAVTNVLATQRGRTVGLITTAGFEGHLHATRGHRKSEDGWLVHGWNPVAIDAVRGVNERIDRDGAIVKPLNVAEVEAAAKWIAEEHDVDAFAISFLWSFRNPAHEDAAVEAIRRLYPKAAVFGGASLSPVMREYERTPPPSPPPPSPPPPPRPWRF
jgi:N-methylhydantoinase A